MLIEITTFRLAAGVEDDTFLAADERVQTEVFNPAPGFVRRTTAHGEDGEWLVIVMWDREVGIDASATRELDALIDPSTLRVARYNDIGG